MVAWELLIVVCALQNYGHFLQIGSLFVKVRWLASFAWFIVYGGALLHALRFGVVA